MGATQDLDQPDFGSATAGLWDNRSNYDASGNVYPSSGGSGTSGAILKSDQWRISVAGTLGGTAVSVGDVLVALVDSPGSTSSNWMVLQGNVVAFTGDSGSGGTEGLVPAPAAGDAAANKFLKANGQWVAVSSSNLGSANLTSADDARTFTLKSGGTASQNFQILNSASQIGYYFDGTGSVAIGTTTTSGKLTIKGSGSTSATTTALFQNSSSAKSLEILDSGAINIYNSGNFKIGYLNVYGGGVFGGNNNGGIGNDPNNVLGGSYQNGIILGGYNNTHNGYQGVIGGGFNTVTTNGTWNFVFSVGSTASAAAASVFGGASHTASGAYSAVLGGLQNTASGEGSVAVGGSQASASGYRSFAQGYGSYATSDYAVVMGSYCSAVARSARAVGEYCVASGVSSWASGLGTLYGGTGKDLNASGLVSFNHSFNDGTVLYRSAEGNYSAILGGTNHWTKSGSTSSAILGGEGNTINASVLRSVILGGTGITATASDTAYAININASTLITTPQVITTPATITVAANAGTVTRANRINKFTNSSAATMTITMSTTAALDGDLVQVRIYDFSAATQTITWVNTENSSVTVPATSNGSTTLPLTVGFQYNSATSKWRCIGSV